MSDGLIEAVMSEHARPVSTMIYTFERSLHPDQHSSFRGLAAAHQVGVNHIIHHPLMEDEARGWGMPQVIRSFDSRVD